MAHLQTIEVVPDQMGRGTDPNLAICGAPASEATLPQWPNCTLTPQAWTPPICGSPETWWCNMTTNGSCPLKNNRSCPGHPGPAPPTPPPPPAPPVPPPPAQCGKLLLNTGVANTPENNTVAASVDECCAQCLALSWCAKWAWHAELRPQLCHKHLASGTISPCRGSYAGSMNRSASLSE